uniref:S100/CaBP-9k-type calcium binding subdomain domain-containing protein n=1 Tax=Strigops habroptila TaxID=2489341 RepID=A0A672UYE6_STRHB
MRALTIHDSTDALRQEQLDECSIWVLLKDLEDNNMMDFKEYVVLLGCLTMLCVDFYTEAHGPARQQ